MSTSTLQAAIADESNSRDFFRTHVIKLVAAVRAADLDALPPVCRELFELFAESQDFLRIGEIYALPSPEEANHYLASEYCRYPSRTREIILVGAAKLLDLPGAQA